MLTLTYLDKVMDRLQIHQIVVVDVNTKAEEQTRIASVNDLKKD